MYSRSLSQEAVPTMTNNNNKRRNNRSNPVSFSPRLTTNAPGTQRVSSGKDLIVTEFSGSQNFLAQSYPLNPRLAGCFPSASLTAQRYDMYKFEELVFHYHPTTAVTTTKGVVFLAWEPNANRGPPSSLQQINAYECEVEGPVYSSDITLRVPASKLGGFRYVRSGPNSFDLNNYDTGNLIVASDDVAGAEGGYIEVYYRIRFLNYHLEEAESLQSKAAYAVMTTDILVEPGDPPEKIVWDTLPESFGACSMTQLTAARDGLILPSGKYLCLCDVNFTGTQVSGTHLVSASFDAPGLTIPINSVSANETTVQQAGIALHLHGIITINERGTLSVQLQVDPSSTSLTASSSRLTVIALS